MNGGKVMVQHSSAIHGGVPFIPALVSLLGLVMKEEVNCDVNSGSKSSRTGTNITVSSIQPLYIFILVDRRVFWNLYPPDEDANADKGCGGCLWII